MARKKSMETQSAENEARIVELRGIQENMHE